MTGGLRVGVTISPGSALPGVRGFMVVQAVKALGEVTVEDGRLKLIVASGDRA